MYQLTQFVIPAQAGIQFPLEKRLLLYRNVDILGRLLKKVTAREGGVLFRNFLSG